MLLSSTGNFSKYQRYLVGDILSIRPAEIVMMFCAGIALLVVWIFFYNQMVLTTMHSTFAKSRGVHTFFIEQLFALLTAAIVTISIRWTGLLVINSMLVLPAAASRMQRQKEQSAELDVKSLKLQQREITLTEKDKTLKEIEHRKSTAFLEETRSKLENLVRELREGEITREKTIGVKQFISELTGQVDAQEDTLLAQEEALAKEREDVAKETERLTENGIRITRTGTHAVRNFKRGRRKSPVHFSKLFVVEANSPPFITTCNTQFTRIIACSCLSDAD